MDEIAPLARPRRRTRRRMSMVFQSYALYPHMSVRQDIGESRARAGDRVGLTFAGDRAHLLDADGRAL